MKSWIRDKIWNIVAPFVIVGIAWLVGIIFNFITKSQGWDELLTTLYKGAIDFINNCSLW